MVRIEYTKEFQQIFSKIKDNFLKKKIIKQIEKIRENPEIGKPMKGNRKGTREVYIKPYRLSYSFNKNILLIYILDLYHKKFQ